MIRLLATAFLFGICFLLGVQQQNVTPKSVIAVSMRHGNKTAFTEYQAPIAGAASTVTATTVTADMIAPKNNREECLRVADSNRTTVRSCIDSRTLTLLPNATLTATYQISGTTYVLDFDPIFGDAETPQTHQRLGAYSAVPVQ